MQQQLISTASTEAVCVWAEETKTDWKLCEYGIENAANSSWKKALTLEG